MTQPIITAQIGCGYWGPNLLRNLSTLPASKVKYVAEASQARRDYVSQNFPGTRVTPRWEDVLEDPEVQAVVIATPAFNHAELTMKFLEAGKHVFVEKPLAMTAAEADALMAAARSKNLTLMVGHTYLYNNSLRWLKQALDRGEFGELYCIYCQRVNLGQLRSDVNAWWNLAPHDLSVLLYLMDGKLPERISAHGKAFIQPGIEDVVFANYTWKDGPVANVHVSWLDPHKIRKTTVVGSRKMAVFDDMDAEKPITVFDKGFDEIPRIGERMDFDLTAVRAGYTMRQGEIHIPVIERAEPLRAEIEDFLESLRTGKEPYSKVRQARDVVWLLEETDKLLKKPHG
jgi:predicted dehydrogenase